MFCRPTMTKCGMLKVCRRVSLLNMLWIKSKTTPKSLLRPYLATGVSTVPDILFWLLLQWCKQTNKKIKTRYPQPISSPHFFIACRERSKALSRGERELKSWEKRHLAIPSCYPFWYHAIKKFSLSECWKAGVYSMVLHPTRFSSCATLRVSRIDCVGRTVVAWYKIVM